MLLMSTSNRNPRASDRRPGRSVHRVHDMRAACVQCRVRKVRCDGPAPSCRPCERLRFDCSFQPKPSGGYAFQIPPKRRGTEACLECRSMKARCSREAPRCSNCYRRNRQCSYASASRPTASQTDVITIDRSTHTPSPQSSSSTNELAPAIPVAGESIASAFPSSTTSILTSPTSGVATQLVARYFDCLFPLPSFGFLHRETVVQRCNDDTIDLPLKLAICAITSMFLNQHQTQRNWWAQESERLMLDRLEKPSIFLIQASLLTIRFRAAVGQFPRAFIFAGLASRWAVALRLNYEHSGLGPIAQEVRRRTMWSLYLLEDSFCVGLKEFELLDPDVMHLQLPCEDCDFTNGRPVSTGFLHPKRGVELEVLGSRACFIKLTSIRRGIMRLNRRICAKEITQSELFTCIECYQNQLLRLRTRLAPSDQYPRIMPQELSWPPQYALVHMSWHQCHCDLYRIFLTDYPELGPHAALQGISEPERESMKDKCLEHAEQIVRVLSDFVHHKEEQHMLEHDAAVCAYHAARLILFGAYTASHGSEFPMQLTTNKAQLCLDVITRYFGFSAQLESMRHALERAIDRHKTRPKATGHVGLSTRDLDPVPPRISRDAHNRQTLAIHSLLRQSDFVDDSREAALEPQINTAIAVTPPTAIDVATATDIPQGRLDWNLQETMLPPWNIFFNDPNTLYGLPYGTGILDFNESMMQGTDELGILIGGLDEQCMY